MIEINNNDINSIFYEINKKYIIPKFKNLKDNEIKFKNKKDIVTTVDISIEKYLEKKLKKIIPNSLFIGEELYNTNPNIINFYNSNELCWTVDPIDGTRNFVKGDDMFAIMIALSKKNKILQSWIYRPMTDEFCYAIKDKGAYLNYNKIMINKITNIDQSIGSISNKYWQQNEYNQIDKIKNLFKKVNSYGCIGLEYIDIIKSIRNFAILSKLNPWDHVPGILILREAGGFDSFFNGQKYIYPNKNNLVIASDQDLGNKILSLLMGEKL